MPGFQLADEISLIPWRAVQQDEDFDEFGQVLAIVEVEPLCWVDETLSRTPQCVWCVPPDA